MNENNIEKLINAASSKLGTSPDNLRRALENGDMKTLSAGLSKSDKAKLRSVLSNKELMKKLKNASDPAEILRMLNKQ